MKNKSKMLHYLIMSSHITLFFSSKHIGKK